VSSNLIAAPGEQDDVDRSFRKCLGDREADA
jgi:hypothetical protein